MNSYFKNLIGLTLILCSLAGSANAQETMAILSDNLRAAYTNYIVYPETSNLIGQDLANRINTNAKIKALTVSNTINNAKQHSISEEVIQLSKEYQYTYSLNYNMLRKISDKLGAGYILLITSSVDIETDFLKGTLWNMIPLAGENTVNPSYKVVTQIMLVDPKKELILLEKNYSKSIPSKNFDLVMPMFSPCSGQLDKFKNYSHYIAKNVTPIIETIIIPDLTSEKRTHIENIRYNLENLNKKPQKQEELGLEIKPDPNLKINKYDYDNL